MEFYLNQSIAYQSGQNDYRYVNLGMLPPSVQQQAYDALQNPSAAGNLVVLADLQEKYPSAFSRTTGLNTLPAPANLGGGGMAFPLGASLDMVLAYLNDKVFKTANQLSADGKNNAIEASHMSMGIADKVKTEQEAAATSNLAAGVAGGTLALAAGIGTTAVSVYSGLASRANAGEIKSLTKDQLSTQQYQDTMERNVKQMQDIAKTDRANAQQLKGYADEINSPDGLSPASRQKIDDAMAQKNAQLDDIRDQLGSYDNAVKKAKDQSLDPSLSEAERAAAKQQWEDLKKDQPRIEKDLGDQANRLTAERDAFASLKGMDADDTQIRLDSQRIKALEGNPARTPAEEAELLDLRGSNARRMDSLVTQRTAVQRQIDDFNAEAGRMDAGAADLQKSAQDDVNSRKTMEAERDKDLNQDIANAQNAAHAASTVGMALSQSTGLVSAPFTFQGAMHDAEKEHLQAENQFIDKSGSLDGGFADSMAEKAQGATQFWQQTNQNTSEVLSSIAHNI